MATRKLTRKDLAEAAEKYNEEIAHGTVEIQRCPAIPH